MTSVTKVLDRFDRAIDQYRKVCSSAPDQWHRPDTSEFTELKRLLYPHAKDGNSYRQYALSTIYCWGFAATVGSSTSPIIQSRSKKQRGGGSPLHRKGSGGRWIISLQRVWGLKRNESRRLPTDSNRNAPT
jgi:hypothetical protein